MKLNVARFLKRNKYKVSIGLTIIVSGFCFLSSKMQTSELEYFERISGIKFPDKVSIEFYSDNGEFFACVLLKIDSMDIKSMISKYKFKSITLPIDSTLPNYENLFIDQINTSLKSNTNKIIVNKNLYYIDSCTKNNRIIYVCDKTKGRFWGRIEYPDWSGDPPCGNK